MRHRKLVAPINSIKHYVPKTNTGVASGGLVSEFIADAVVAPATASPFSVREGSIIKAVHVEVWIIGDEATDTTSQFVFVVEKAPGNTTAITVTNLLNLGSYPNKKNVLYTSQGVLGAGIDGNGAIPVFRGWILIPKGKQRMGLDDSLRWHLTGVGSLRVCGLVTYKEFT